MEATTEADIRPRTEPDAARQVTRDRDGAE